MRFVTGNRALFRPTPRIQFREPDKTNVFLIRIQARERSDLSQVMAWGLKDG